MVQIHTFQTINEFLQASNVHHLSLPNEQIVVGRFEDITKMVPGNFISHRNTFFEVAFFRKSINTLAQLGKNIFTVSDNFVFANPPGPLRNWKKNEDWAGYFLFFKPEFLAFGLNNQNIFQEYPFFSSDALPVFQIPDLEIILLEEVYQKMIYEYQHYSAQQPAVLQLYLNILLQHLKRLYTQQEQNLQKLEQATGTSRKDMIRAQFEVLIRQNLTEKISIEAYAEQLCISPNYLTKSIKQTTGKSPQQLIQEYKIREAEALLVQTDLSVSEIAYYLEFTDPSHFIRVFKTVNVGQTPQAFRASIVQNTESLAK